MDHSQNSDIFSNSEEYYKGPSKIDIGFYKSLVSSTKISLSKSIIEEVHEPTFATHFTALLEDCCTCVFQSLDLVIELLQETDLQITKLCSYLEDAVCMLQLLSSFIKNIIESVSMRCSSMRTFPSTTGRIILAVFTHCKDSEPLYGSHLKVVEKQLKDLFRSCHELQLSYLMILEKYVVFDLDEKEEFDILVDALDINLKIGDIVQSLDVKTMAEQWKAYTMICEKYSVNLSDTNIFYNCTEILCEMIKKNMNMAVEIDQEEKIIVRSLKVSSFTIKILLRVCNIFRLATDKNHDHIMELLLYICLNNCAYLELTAEKSLQFVNLMDTNVTSPTDAVLNELLMDEKFVKCVTKLDVETMKTEDRLLGYIVLIVSIIKSVLLKNNNDCKLSKIALIACIYRILPFGHVWFNIGLKFRTPAQSKAEKETYGLYEHLLTHTFALAASLNDEEMNTLEQKMYESVLGTNCISALFSLNLWILLSSLSSRQLLSSQVMSLCKIYQKLENNILFANSPQHIQLAYTMSELFAKMHNEDKMKLIRQFNINEEKNASLWCSLKIRNLPDDAQSNAEQVIVDKCKVKFHKVFFSGVQGAEEIHSLTKTMKLAATCSFTQSEDILEDCVIEGWTKMCPKNNKFILLRGELDRGSVWCLDYIEALVSLTHSSKYIFQNTDNLVKILHTVSNMIQVGNIELKLVLIDLLCKMSLQQIQDENKPIVDALRIQSYKNLLQDNYIMAKNRFLNILKQHVPNNNIEAIIHKINNENSSCKETWDYFVNNQNLDFQNVHWKEQLMKAMDLKYCHKCIENNSVIELSGSESIDVKEKANSNNFDLADIDSLFEVESDSEPACKKLKLNTDNAEEIIVRLENDALLLSNIKDVLTNECKHRIRDVCQKLKNIID